MHFNASIMKVLATNRLDHRVSNLRGLGAGLGDGVDHPITVREKGRQVTQGNVAILVDSTP
jgi:hypothetical protein